MPRPPLPVVGADSNGAWGTKNNALWTDAHASLDRLDTPVIDMRRSPYNMVASSTLDQTVPARAAIADAIAAGGTVVMPCLLYTSPSPRDS